MQKCWQKWQNCLPIGKDDWIPVPEASFAIGEHFLQFPGVGKDCKNKNGKNVGKNASQLAKMTGSQFQRPAMPLESIFAKLRRIASLSSHFS